MEFAVLKILKTIYHISACHRLYNKNNRYPSRTIVRLTNRKITEYCLFNRHTLSEFRQALNMNLRFYEHLPETNESVLKECIKLANYGCINSYFIRNGFVKIAINHGDKPFKIYHPGTLDFYDHQNLFLV